MIDYDILIIGAGVVGLASAQHFAKMGYSVLVIERHASFAQETSSRNSEVIHAGIYYPTGSLKAKLCVTGNKKIYEWADQYNVPYKNTGKYIIATQDNEIDKLNEIYQQGRSNGVNSLQIADIDKLRSEEPYINANAALWSPDTGIIDSHKLMESFITVAETYNCDFAWKHTAFSINYIDNYFNVKISDPDNDIVEISVKYVINAAGLDSDTVAQKAGIDIDKHNYRLNFCRGHYYRIKNSKKHLAKHLIYPVPPADKSGLGIHVTLDMNGELKLGPDTEYLKNRIQDYSVSENLHTKFYNAASRYLIGLEYDDISPDQSGIRPKLQIQGGPVRDFIISEESDLGLPGLINLIGIESPGLTCSIAIAEHIESLINKL